MPGLLLFGSKEEQQLLEARLSAKAGKPIMSDAEYDALKAKLAGSGVFQVGRRGVVSTAAQGGGPGTKGPSRRRPLCDGSNSCERGASPSARLKQLPRC